MQIVLCAARIPSPIQTILSVLDSHQIMPCGSRTCLLRGITVGREYRSSLFLRKKRAPCPEDRYFISSSILLFQQASVNYAFLLLQNQIQHQIFLLTILLFQPLQLHRKLDPLLLKIHAQNLYFHNIPHADRLQRMLDVAP